MCSHIISNFTEIPSESLIMIVMLLFLPGKLKINKYEKYDCNLNDKKSPMFLLTEI